MNQPKLFRIFFSRMSQELRKLNISCHFHTEHTRTSQSLYKKAPPAPPHHHPHACPVAKCFMRLLNVFCTHEAALWALSLSVHSASCFMSFHPRRWNDGIILKPVLAALTCVHGSRFVQFSLVCISRAFEQTLAERKNRWCN